jgi:hypothetical protein
MDTTLARETLQSAWLLKVGLLIAFQIFAFAGTGCTTPSKPIHPTSQDALVAPPMTNSNHDMSDWYPDASRRMHETGMVVIHFTVGDRGVPKQPFIVDEKTSAPDRLIDIAQKALYGAIRLQVGAGYKQSLTASFLFELEPCSFPPTPPVSDYVFRLCVEPKNLPKHSDF